MKNNGDQKGNEKTGEEENKEKQVKQSETVLMTKPAEGFEPSAGYIEFMAAGLKNPGCFILSFFTGIQSKGDFFMPAKKGCGCGSAKTAKKKTAKKK